MKLPTRHLAALLVSAGLLLTGCSGASTGNADGSTTDTPSATATTAETGGTCDAKVTGASAPASADTTASQEALGTVGLEGDAKAAPTLTFTAPLAIGSEVVKVVSEGDGDQISAGQLLTFNYIVCDIVTGEKLYSTWGLTPDKDAPETYVLSPDNFGEHLAAAFEGHRVGARLLWAQPGISAEQSATGQADNGYLYAMTITGAQTVPESASGAAVAPTDTSLPAITFTDGKPAVSFPSTFTEPIALVIQPLIKGEGATVESGQTVIVKYSGWLTDGTKFDSSWDRTAPNDMFTFQAGIGGVIKGWDQGVVGQQVGSRLLLVVPSDLGYGADGGGDKIPANATLVFVVDILAAY